MLGESNRGAQNQSTEPSDATSADVWRSPMRPWSAMSGYSESGMADPSFDAPCRSTTAPGPAPRAPARRHRAPRGAVAASPAQDESGHELRLNPVILPG